MHTPILHEDTFVTDFHVNSEIFNSHFARQCFLLKNESQIPPQFLSHTNIHQLGFNKIETKKLVQKLQILSASGTVKICKRLLSVHDF